MADTAASPVMIELKGRIDSNNAQAVWEAINQKIAGKKGAPVDLDCQKLVYISSAGLRGLLRLRKSNPDITIRNVNPDVFMILEMTGFTQFMNVERAYREVSIEGCEEIGRGSNGRIYRISDDEVVKVYKDQDALSEIRHEREVAQLALVLGIPTAISYDVVRVGERYGSAFELLRARSFSRILAEEPEKLDWCVSEYVRMMKRLHTTEVPEGKLPDMKETAVGWVLFLKDYLPVEAGEKLLALVREVPRQSFMIHGDFHTKNLVLQEDEVLLIDMDTLSAGHPIFELCSIFNSFAGFSELDHERFRKFQGFDRELGQVFWRRSLMEYLGTDQEERFHEVEDKARILGYTRLIRRSIRRNGFETEKGRAEIAHWKAELLELLDRTDTLLF